MTYTLCQKYNVKGWRQKCYNVRKIKSIILQITKIKRSKPRKEISILEKEKKLNKAYKKLIKAANLFMSKSQDSIEEAGKELKENSIVFHSIVSEITKFINFADKFIDQIKRRVFNREKIPHDEKIFSVFEPFTEWIAKGKFKTPFELGKRVAIVEDQYGFILSHKVMDRETDEKITTSIVNQTKQKFDNLTVCSFDKGFYSKENREILSQTLEFPVLPKKGKLSKKDIELESSKEFMKYRKKHPAVESAINALEVHGLDKCLDKGFYGFKRYVSLAITSRNIQRLGFHLKLKEIKNYKKHKIKIAV